MSRKFPNPRWCAACGLFAAALSLSAAAAGTPSPSIQHRIDALLKRRLNPDGLPAELPNPFQVVKGTIRETVANDSAARSGTAAASGASASTIGANPSPIPADVSNATVLAGTVAKLKVGGVMILKGQMQVVINGVPRAEGDMIAADWNSNLIYLKVLRLFPGEVVLRYGDAEATLKL